MIERELLYALPLLPLLGVLSLFVVRQQRLARRLSVGAAIGSLVIALALIPSFDGRPGMGTPSRSDDIARFVTRPRGQLSALHLQHSLGLNGLSLPLVILTTFIVTIVCAAARGVHGAGLGFFALVLLLETFILGTFLSTDILFFYVFLELTMVFAWLLVRRGLAPETRRRRAPITLLLYLVPAAILLLVPVVGIALRTGTCDLSGLPSVLAEMQASNELSRAWCNTFFALLMAGFLIHCAIAPAHAWILDAHAEASAPSSMLLAGLVQNMGAYAVLRIAYALFPTSAAALWCPIAAIGVANVFYGALCAMAQTDLKRVLAHASIGSMGLVWVGIALMDRSALAGAMLLVLSNGLAYPMLFYLTGLIEERTGHRELARLSGLSESAPRFALFIAFAMFAAIGVPLTCTFAGEFLILSGTFQAARGSALLVTSGLARPGTITTIAVLSCFGAALNAVAILSALHRLLVGRPGAAQTAARESVEPGVRDLGGHEVAMLAPVALIIVLLGVLPSIFYFGLAGGTIDAMSAACRRAVAAMPKRASTDVTATKPVGR